MKVYRHLCLGGEETAQIAGFSKYKYLKCSCAKSEKFKCKRSKGVLVDIQHNVSFLEDEGWSRP